MVYILCELFKNAMSLPEVKILSYILSYSFKDFFSLLNF